MEFVSHHYFGALFQNVNIVNDTCHYDHTSEELTLFHADKLFFRQYLVPRSFLGGILPRATQPFELMRPTEIPE